MDDFVTIRSFSNSIDFEMARTYLESFDVECFGQDEMSNRSFLPNANGGVKLQVRPEQVGAVAPHVVDGAAHEGRLGGGLTRRGAHHEHREVLVAPDGRVRCALLPQPARDPHASTVTVPVISGWIVQ